MAGLFSRVKTWLQSENLKASDVNAEFNNIITNLNAPQVAGDSPTVARMKAEEDPGSQGTESLATSIAGELRRLRFVVRRAFGTTYWYDTPPSDITSLYNLFAAGTTVPQNRIDSGRIDGNGQPMFLMFNGTTGLRLKASIVPFKAYIKGTLIQVNSDVDFAGLTAASAFTALVNDTTLAAAQLTRIQGEGTSLIAIDTNVGSAPTANTFQAWKLAHTAFTDEYFFGRFDSTTQISACYRGLFFNTGSLIIERIPMSNNDQLTLCKAVYVFFTYASSTPALEVTYNLPTISGTQPASASTGDWWLDLTTNIWKKFNGSSWADGNGLWIGLAVMDGASLAGVRSFDFGKAFSQLNTVTPVKFDSATVKSNYLSSSISVYGNLMKFDKNILSWSMATNLDDGISEGASTRYWFYMTPSGVVKISDRAPHRRVEDLLGWYHNSKPYRCIGYADNDGSSNLGDVTLQDTVPYIGLDPIDIQQSSSSGAFTSTSTSLVDVTNLSITYKKGPRPCLVKCIPSGIEGGTNPGNGAFTTGGAGEAALLKDATLVDRQLLPTSAVSLRGLEFLDTGVAGTYTYKVQARSPGGNTVGMKEMILTVIPL